LRGEREPAPAVKPPPSAALHARMIAALAAVEAEQGGDGARELRAALEAWWRAQQEWNAHLAELFGAHHEINNALVGIRGNAQLILRSPVAEQPGVRERLEVVIRESQRIQEAVARLGDARSAFLGSDPASRAA